MARSLLLSAYLAWSARGGRRFAERRLTARLEAGKEDPIRVDERRGIASIPRPNGPVIWFHAASVGESLAVLELVRRILEEREDAHVLVTTGTVTSASVMADRLPSRAMHQYAPVDAVAYVRAFLDHWKPDLAIWTESELWPALVCETGRRQIPMLLLNARMSRRSHDRWRFLRGVARALLTQFRTAMVQDQASMGYLRALGMPQQQMRVMGTLKEGASALPCDQAELDRLSKMVAGRPVWLAASTHPGEEALVLEAHRAASRISPRLLLILVPRHPERGGEIAQLITEAGFRSEQRSLAGAPEEDVQVYLADSLGEMGLWFRLAPVSFVGGSLVPIGGHNPFEPAGLGSAILHGPYVTNFADIYTRLSEAGAAETVTAPEHLANQVIRLLSPEAAAQMATAAWSVVSDGADITDRAVELVLDTLDAAEIEALRRGGR